MSFALPSPILSVNLEGLRELDGREALSGLWTLFSKCKDSIDGGHRLENIFWRLWYRDMLVTDSAQSVLRPRNPSSEPLNETAYRHPTPVETVLSSQPCWAASGPPAAFPPISSKNLHSVTPPAASGSQPVTPGPHHLFSDSIRKPSSLFAVGQICEILPNSFDPIQSLAVPPRHISLSMSPSSGGAPRIPRPELLSTLPASSGRSDPLHIPDSAFLPLVPLLPLPELNSSFGTRIVASSQPSTPGTERDESALFVNRPCTLDRVRYRDSSVGPKSKSSAVSPNYQREWIAGPPSPSPSDLYVRAHPNENATVDHPEEGGVPGIQVLVQNLDLPQMHSDAETGAYKCHSLTVSTLDEDMLVPVVATPPRSVVVTPTPGPAPHPTSPATPLVSIDNATLRPWGQFPRSARMDSKQLASVPALIVSIGSSSPAGNIRGPVGVNLDYCDRSTAPLKDSGRTVQQIRATPAPQIHQIPRTQKQPSVEEQPAEASMARNGKIHASPIQNSNRLPTSFRSTGGTTTSNASSSSGPPVGATGTTSAKSAVWTEVRFNARPVLARTASSGGGWHSWKAGGHKSQRDVVTAAGALAATMGKTTVPTVGPPGGARKRMGTKMGGKGRFSLAKAVSRSIISGGAASKRTLSHEGVAEVTGDEDDGEIRATAAAREQEQREKERREREAAVRDSTALEEKKQNFIAKASRERTKFRSHSEDGSNLETETSSRSPGSGLYDGYAVNGKGRGLDMADQERHSHQLKERDLAEQRAREDAAILERERQAKQGQAGKVAEVVAKARPLEPLAGPLLLRANKRILLLANQSESESDYSDTDDESWTSEDAEEGGTARVLASRHLPPNACQFSHHESRHHPPPHPQQHPPRPPAVQRTHPNASGRTSQPEWQQLQQQREAQLRIQKVAARLQREDEEKQRQRDMFAKNPTTSYQDLTETQNRSPGLLTQLMKPDSAIFPDIQPYGRGHSSGENQRMRMTPMATITAEAQPQQQQPAPNGQATAAPIEQRTTQPCDRQQQSNDPNRTRAPPRRSAMLDSQPMRPRPPPVTSAAATDSPSAVFLSSIHSHRRAPSLSNVRGIRALGLAYGKSTTAGPIASQVIAGSVTNMLGPPRRPFCSAKGIRANPLT